MILCNSNEKSEIKLYNIKISSIDKWKTSPCFYRSKFKFFLFLSLVKLED